MRWTREEWNSCPSRRNQKLFHSLSAANWQGPDGNYWPKCAENYRLRRKWAWCIVHEAFLRIPLDPEEEDDVFELVALENFVKKIIEDVSNVQLSD